MVKEFGARKEMGNQIKFPVYPKKNLKEMTLVISKNHNNQNLKFLIDKIQFQ